MSVVSNSRQALPSQALPSLLLALLLLLLALLLLALLLLCSASEAPLNLLALLLLPARVSPVQICCSLNCLPNKQNILKGRCKHQH